jgi:hypothetical protein
MFEPRVALGLALLAGSIVVPGTKPVNVGTVRHDKSSARWADGSPMPIPKPTGKEVQLADGSPMPLPKPKDGGSLVADGSPMPLPKPTGGVIGLLA